MTTDPAWKALELVEPADPTRRSESLVALTDRLEPALNRLGAREAVATYWSTTGVPDTRLARAKGFWKARLDVAATVPSSAALSADPVLGSDGLHFLGTARAPLSELARLLLSVLRYERNRGCVFVPLSEGISTGSLPRVHEVLSGARFELELVEAVGEEARRQNVVVIVPTGRFDDRESSLVLNGPATLAGYVPGLHLARP